MPVIRSADAPIFDTPGIRFTGLAAPSRGSAELCVWQIEVAPNVTSDAHTIDHEEVFVMLDGNLTMHVAGEPMALATGDALIVPAHSQLQLTNISAAPARATVCLPVGAKATITGTGVQISPPWAR